MSEWQDIETAPKDGTPILAAVGPNGVYIVAWERWRPSSWTWRHPDPDYVEVFSEGDWGWFCGNFYVCQQGWIVEEIITHWMPLPENPNLAMMLASQAEAFARAGL